MIKDGSDFSFDGPNLGSIWSFLDGPAPGLQTFSSALDELQNQSRVVLPFSVRYQLEVCFSENLLNEHTISEEFLHRLEKMEESQALAILEKLASDIKPAYDLTALLTADYSEGTSSSSKIPHYCAHVRSAFVTPTTIYYYPPTIEISNRVIRQYSAYSDRFLRVRFGAERHIGRLYPSVKFANGKSAQDNIYKRIRHTMMVGIHLGARHYDFLAFGNSQFREHGAYFFASTEQVNVNTIRKWMGDFAQIHSISRYTARLGQCFSTTRAIRSAKAALIDIPDIRTHDDKYIFTDGVGKIERPLMQFAAEETGVLGHDNEPPSVMQFRLGGCKGVLTVHQGSRMRIYIRESQYKFPAQYEGLEVIRWSQFSAAHLNRQLISVLSTLGVPDKVFIAKARAQLADLEASMVDEEKAILCLRREVDPNQVTLALASMVEDGFHASQEPFVMNMLYLWRAYCMKYLKENAKISIQKGASLLGCVDEFGVLKGHTHKTPVTSNAAVKQTEHQDVPEIFVQITKGCEGCPKIITGYMLLARNPSLHPGDIRVVRGVDHAALRHLKDVVVLPQKGDRDLASMCSGGDLDGDDYVVLWDEALIPQEWNVEPMDYSPPPELRKDGDVTIEDVIDFFVTYMTNNSLGTIANAHLATADRSRLGVKDPKCKICRCSPILLMSQQVSSWPRYILRLWTIRRVVELRRWMLGCCRKNGRITWQQIRAIGNSTIPELHSASCST